MSPEHLCRHSPCYWHRHSQSRRILISPTTHRQIPYGTAMSYPVSTSYIYPVPACPAVQLSGFYTLRRPLPQAFLQDIDAYICIPVVNRMAARTFPDASAQIFYQRISIAAGTAGLTVQVYRWYSADLISIPGSFISAFQKTLPTKHRLSILPVYVSGSFHSHASLRYR